MTRTRMVELNATLKADADATRACGAYSQANPHTALKDNPYYAETLKTSRAVSREFGRQALWHCPACGRVIPDVVEDDLLGGFMTDCCGSHEVEMRTKS